MQKFSQVLSGTLAEVGHGRTTPTLRVLLRPMTWVIIPLRERRITAASFSLFKGYHISVNRSANLVLVAVEALGT